MKLYVNGLGWDDEAGWEPDADQGSHERRSVPRSYQTMSRPTLRRTDIVVIDAASFPQGRRCGGGQSRPVRPRDRTAILAAIFARPPSNCIGYSIPRRRCCARRSSAQSRGCSDAWLLHLRTQAFPTRRLFQQRWLRSIMIGTCCRSRLRVSTVRSPPQPWQCLPCGPAQCPPRPRSRRSHASFPSAQ